MGADGRSEVKIARPREGLGGLRPPKNKYFHSGVVRPAHRAWRGDALVGPRPEPRAGVFQGGISHVGSDVLSALKLRQGWGNPVSPRPFEGVPAGLRPLIPFLVLDFGLWIATLGSTTPKTALSNAASSTVWRGGFAPRSAGLRRNRVSPQPFKGRCARCGERSAAGCEETGFPRNLSREARDGCALPDPPGRQIRALSHSRHVQVL